MVEMKVEWMVEMKLTYLCPLVPLSPNTTKTHVLENHLTSNAQKDKPEYFPFIQLIRNFDRLIK